MKGPDGYDAFISCCNESGARDLYDDLNRLTKWIEPAPTAGANRPETIYSYDAANNRETLTDPNGNITTWAFDALNRVEKEIDPLAHETLFQYDLNGNRTEQTDRIGRITKYCLCEELRLWQLAAVLHLRRESPAALPAMPPLIVVSQPGSPRNLPERGALLGRCLLRYFFHQPHAAKVAGSAGAVEGIEPVVLAPEPLPFHDDAFAGHELLGLLFSRQVLGQRQMLFGGGLKQRHGAWTIERRGEPLVDPGLPVVGVDLGQVQLFGRQPVEMKPLTNVPYDRAGMRRSVIPLAMLLCGAAPERRPKALARLSAKRIHDRRHVPGVDPDLMRNQRFASGSSYCTR